MAKKFRLKNLGRIALGVATGGASEALRVAGKVARGERVKAGDVLNAATGGAYGLTRATLKTGRDVLLGPRPPAGRVHGQRRNLARRETKVSNPAEGRHVRPPGAGTPARAAHAGGSPDRLGGPHAPRRGPPPPPSGRLYPQRRHGFRLRSKVASLTAEDKD